MNNCDIRDILTEEDKKGELLYGKRMLVSHRQYDLWNEKTDDFNLFLITELYKMFIYNMSVAAMNFKTKWVKPHELLTTSKGLIWDWTSEEERQRTADDILACGLYFPILTLDKGRLHNQIVSEEEKSKLSAKGLYNSYNGNHRIDAIQLLEEQGKWNGKSVLIYIIPEYCQKSCTGFKYDLIDDMQEHYLTQWKLPKPIFMFHLDYVEHEMKVFNWRDKRKTHIEGVSMAYVDSYNVAFRLMLEIQNALEPVLTRYYQLNNTLPKSIMKLNRFFNNPTDFLTMRVEVLDNANSRNSRNMSVQKQRYPNM